MNHSFNEGKNIGKEISSLYLHFPFCKHLCNFCDFYKSLAKGGIPELKSFHKYLDESMAKLKILIEKHHMKMKALDTFYIGGGTPSLWGTEGAKFIQDFLKQNEIFLAPNAEFTMEVDPGSWQGEGINSWKEIGVNRFSLGIQTLDQKIFPHLDRGHTLMESFQTLEYFSQEGTNFSVDFILGIPHSTQNKRNITRELERILSFGTKHVSMYILTVNKGYPLRKMLPEDDFVRNEYLEASQYLEEKGFRHYEVSNFALPGMESKHNLAYWTFKSVAALGKSATGIFYLRDDKALRFKWKTTDSTFLTEELGEEEIRLERLYLMLRTDLGFNPQEFFDAPNLQKFILLTKDWEKRELLKESGPSLKLSNKGLIILDTLMGEIFKSLNF